MNRVTGVILASIVAIFVGTILVILLARGYTVDFRRKTLNPTGILVATSDPDGAQVFIDGQLKTATNNSIGLAPGSYRVKIQKEGFTPWEKRVEIKREEVFKTNVFLSPMLPELRPLTFSGSKNPILSPDGTKLAYSVDSASAQRNGVFVLDMAAFSLPVVPSDARQIHRNTPFLSLSDASFLWSADSKSLLAYFGELPAAPHQSWGEKINEQPVATTAAFTVAATTAYLLDADGSNENPSWVSGQLTSLLSQWEDYRKTKLASQTTKLDSRLKTAIATSAATLFFSPDETKILYQATASASLPPILTTYLPGKNPTPETRNLTSRKTYVYDLKEDKNYEITDCLLSTANCWWFPNSRYLLVHSDREIALVEYDGTNKAVIYTGPFVRRLVFPWPNGSKIVILSSLNAPVGVENLYAISLR